MRTHFVAMRGADVLNPRSALRERATSKDRCRLISRVITRIDVLIGFYGVTGLAEYLENPGDNRNCALVGEHGFAISVLSGPGFEVQPRLAQENRTGEQQKPGRVTHTARGVRYGNE